VPPPAPPGPRKSGWRWVRRGLALVVLLAIGAGGVYAHLAVPVPPVPHVTVSLIANIEQIREAATAQAAALVRGDQDGWLAPVESGLRDKFQKRYDILHALKVITLAETVAADPSTEDDDLATLHTTVRYGYCAVVDPCPTGPPRASGDFPKTEGYLADVVWERRVDGYVITDYHQVNDRTGYVPQPWLDVDMTTMSGDKATVFALASEDKDLIKSVFDQAEAAAGVADQYATDKVPARYVVYIAPPAQWRSWFGGMDSDTDVLGYALSTSETSEVVVLNRDNIETNEMAHVLRHEFGHVSTLLGTDRNSGSIGHFWVEGIAELVAQNGDPISSYLSIDYLRGYLRSGLFTGDLDNMDTTYWNTDRSGVVYVMGFMTWQCINDTYGHAKVIDLARQLFRGPAKNIDEAAQSALGTPWSVLEPTCVSYIRSHVS
jgi:hypothetical protein